MYPQEESNTVKSFISSSFGDDKLTKSKELTHEMSIQSSSPDKLTTTLKSLGGNF
jgi:hypothetical protein